MSTDLLNKPDLKPVATGGSYNDLTDLPTLHAMSATGSFNDMVDKPTPISGLGITDYTDIDFDDLGTKPTTIGLWYHRCF